MTITYFSPALNHPVGGIKVLYRHSEMLVANGVDSDVFHPGHPGFSCTWFKHNAKVREEKPFDAQKDWLVIPEFWAADLGKYCLEKKLKYSIFVQNGYLMNLGKAQRSEEDLKKAYESANLIMSVSEDTSDMATLAYPKIAKEKIIKVLPNIGEKFNVGKKKKIISFMPRRLEKHAELVGYFLKEHLPSDWTLLAIDNKSEDEVANILSESSIFLSFSDLEGFGLPPIEAAFCGNAVVGYTGQAGKEYFSQPIFTEIENGNIREFVTNILATVKKVEDGMLTSPAFIQSREKLKEKYSKEIELGHLLNFASRVKQIGGF